MRRPAVVRCGGLAGSVLLALAAWLGGARSPWQPTMSPRTIAAGDDGVLLPVAWLLGTGLLIGAWWVGRRRVPSVRWAYLTAALWALPLLPFLPLGSYDIYSYACQGWQQGAGLDPYAGGVDLLGCPWRASVAPTWLSSPAPYGPVFLVLAAAAAKLGGSLTGALALLRVIAVLGVVLIAVGVPALARRSGVPPERAVWLAVACPLVPVHLVSGAHNDAVMAGLLVAGLAVAATRRHWWLAGLLLALAAGVKATAVVVVPFALLLALRPVPSRQVAGMDSALPVTGSDPRPATPGPTPGRVVATADELWRAVRSRDFLRGGRELAGTFVVTLLAVSLASGRGLGWVTGLAGSGVSVQWTSPPTAVGMAIDLVGPDAVPVTRIAGIVALVVVLGLLWWRAARLAVTAPGTMAAGQIRYAGYALAATVVLAPVFHPWYAVWPLVVLAAGLHRETRWLVVPCAVAAALCLPDGYNLALATKSQGALLMTVFVTVVAWKAVHEAKNRNRRAAGPGHVADRLPGRDA